LLIFDAAPPPLPPPLLPAPLPAVELVRCARGAGAGAAVVPMMVTAAWPPLPLVGTAGEAAPKGSKEEDAPAAPPLPPLLLCAWLPLLALLAPPP
jgi:hypothetical protein